MRAVLASLLFAAAALYVARADDFVVGAVLPMTGPVASTGKQAKAGAELYIAEHGANVAGKTIKLIVKDDGGAPDVSKRLAQDLVGNDHAGVLMGFGISPIGLAVAPVATEAKVPALITAAGAAVITQKSPFLVRTSFTLPQVSTPMADWAVKNGIKRVVTLVSDYGPGIDAEKWFGEEFKKQGGEIVEALRAPLKNPDFAPFLHRAKDDKPDAVFTFVPSGFGGQFIKDFIEQGLKSDGIRLIGTGDLTEDDLVDGLGDDALGVVTTHHYSAAHDSPENKAFVAAFEKAYGYRPNYMAVGAYDGMALVYRALEATKGDVSGPALLAAMKGAKWTSPRGPVEVDPDTRELVQNVYIRKIERRDGHLYNVEIETVPAVKDPFHASGK
jgi:branched-chain amino acid transport system substrate-binding protein